MREAGFDNTYDRGVAAYSGYERLVAPRAVSLEADGKTYNLRMIEMYNARFMTEEEFPQQVANSAFNNAERFFPMLSRDQLATMFGRLERETDEGWYQLMMLPAPPINSWATCLVTF